MPTRRTAVQACRNGCGPRSAERGKRPASGLGAEIHLPPQTLDRRTYVRLAQPLPPAQQKL
ncbi:MAG: hypothetical protein KatS3mg114_0175 [Planctomycetaceae bacterium]|nr:MAG: hypothetical protein KatS3mg114_0175 [Planctomycetaceae bacterium]